MHSAPQPDHAAELLRTLDAAADALRTGDFTAYGAVWAHEPWISVVHPAEREWLTGWEAVGPAYAALLAGGARARPERRIRSLRVSPAGEMAWVTAETIVRTAGAPMVLWQTFVFEHVRDAWRIVHAHASVPATPSTAPSDAI